MKNLQMTVTKYVAMSLSFFCIATAIIIMTGSVMPALEGDVSPEPVSRTFWVGNENVTVEYPKIIEYRTDFGFRTISFTLNAHLYVTVRDPVVLRTFDMLKPYLDGLSDYDKAELLHRFVYDNILYQTDIGKHGFDEFIQYPSETLLDGTGDCEDTSILLVTLYTLAGLDSVFVTVTDHVLVGVAVDGSGHYFNTFGSETRYYAVETTTRWEIGKYNTNDQLFMVFHPTGVILNEGLLLFAVMGFISTYLYRSCKRELGYFAPEVCE